MSDGQAAPKRERPTAEEMLERVRAQGGTGARGRLRVYIGMAPGVGKTYAMLMEAHRRKERGTDVVIGFVETYGRVKTIEAIGDLEIVPRKKIAHKGLVLEEMDTEAVIRRRPTVALVDELAHTNAPGSKHEKRWQDVQDLLDTCITVISTLNIQHVESLGDIVESITGVRVRERIPDSIVDAADEIELVDMSPQALRQRIRHGNVYPPERAEQSLHQFFREGNLAALRELALRRVSTAVEQDLEKYMHGHGIPEAWPAGERVMACIDDSEEAQRVVRRAWRIANRLQADIIAVFVQTPGWPRGGPRAREALESNLRFAEDLGCTTLRTRGDDVARELARVALEQNIGIIVLGREKRGRLYRLLFGSIVDTLGSLTPYADLIVVARKETAE